MSEEMGDAAVDAHMRAKGYEKVHQGSGAYDLDQVYKKDGKYYVVESKGGSSSLGGKSVYNGIEDEFVQQGTRKYLEKTLEDIDSRLKKEINILAKKGPKTKEGLEEAKALQKKRREFQHLKDGIKDGQVHYLLGRQKINKDGTLGEFIMEEFEL